MRTRPHRQDLSFAVDGGCVLIVCAGDAKIDNAKFKAQFHTKATMLTPEQVLDFTGHAVGGVCPFGIDNPAVTATWTCPSAGLTRSTPPQATPPPPSGSVAESWTSCPTAPDGLMYVKLELIGHSRPSVQ